MGRLIYFVSILILFLFKNTFCFHVEFRHHHDIKIEPSNTRTFKRDILQKMDKALYFFNGFQKINSVPVVFPLDICLMNLNEVKYAAVLHINKNRLRNFAVFIFNNDKYNMIAERVTPLAIAMDCRSIGDKGYVALAYNITSPVDNAKEASPVYQIIGNRIRAIQYFPTPNLAEIFLQKSGNDLYMLQTFKYATTTANIQCPYFKWSGTSFNILGRIPCSNARHLEAFAIDYEIYVAVANYADQHGRTKTDSEIYKYDIQGKKFRLFQRIHTNGAVDVKYFNVPLDDGGTRRQHFLIFGNSIISESTTVANTQTVQGAVRNLEADSVFYMFDKGQFVPYQKLSFYNVEQFLPIRSSIAEKFLLLVACKDQDIKIFNLNDWKFEESTVQFTEGALGRGVSKMRIFTTPTESYLVVANELMVANETNIYLPIFKQDEQANLLKEEMIEWTKSNIERLAKVDIEKLKQDVELKLEELAANKEPINVHEIPKSNIQIAKTKSLFYPRLKLGNGYWKALSYAKQALDLLEIKMQESAGREKRASHARVRQVLKASKTTEHEFEQLDVDTLFVNDKLQAININGYNTLDPELKAITAKKVIVTDRYDSAEDAKNFSTTTEDEEELTEDTICVNNLKIAGKLNGFTWNELMNNTLKRQGTIQFLKAPVSLDKLDTETIAVTSDEVSGHSLSKLISIDGVGRYVVNQAIQFAAPIKAKNLVIHERLNNIHVNKDRLDVLLKNSNETQVIKGPKILETIKVMAARTFSDQVVNENLLSSTANKIIPDSLTLNGDFTIMGDVTILNLLAADNIVVDKPKLSTKDILANGLHMDQPLENVNINFEHPLEANNSIVSFINAQDLQMLVKTGIKDVQVVEGKKLFTSSLEIKQGFSEVKNLNGINIEELEKRLFQRSTNQTITMPMHFGKVIVKSLNAPDLTLNAINLTDYLTKSGTQHIRAKLKVDKLTANTLHVDDLHINGKIFDTHLAEIYQQKAKNVPHKNIFQKNRKFKGSIYVHNLKINSTINGISVDLLERQLAQLDGNIKYVGDLKFNYDMRISNLSFYGKFNGIPAKEFGQCWLQKQGVQSFKVPQTLSSVQCERGILLKGRLNGYKAEDFITDTYWINRNEHIKSAIFVDPIELQGALTSNTVNNISIPEDVLYRNSAQSQVLTQPITVQGDLFVTKGHISSITSINGLNLLDLDNFLKGYDADTLFVEHANFAYHPEYKTLNHHNLQNTLDAVWLANENVILEKHIEISDGYFEGLLEFEGPINNINLKYLRDNYFSLSRPQEVSTEMVFNNVVKFEKAFHAEEIHLFGPVKDSKSKFEFKLDDFVSNTVKKSGPHNIGGQWSLLEAIIQGNLNNVLVNKLNLVTDVVRRDVPLNKITVPKRMPAASIRKLFAAPNSLVNSVNVAKWIQDTVFVYENYTISGTTVLDTVNMYNDLQVVGNVNNVTFDENTLLLREHDQVLRGPVRIFNNFPEQQRILPNNIENLWVDTVNDWSVKQFYENQAKFGPTAHVQGSLIFSNPLQVSEFREGDDNFYQDGRGKRRTNDYHENNTFTSWSELEQVVQTLRKSFSAPHYVLEDFEVRQVLKIPSKEIISLPLRLKEDFIDVIAVFNELQENSTQFLNWNNTKQKFVPNQNFSWLSHDKSFEAIGLALQRNDYLEVERVDSKAAAFQHSLVCKDVEGLQMIIQKKISKDVKIERFRRQQEECFAIFSNKSNEVPLYCVKRSPGNVTLELTLESTIKRAHVKQILALSANLIALLYEHSIEIWNSSFTLQPLQRIDLVKPKQLAIGFRGEIAYLAVISEVNENSLHYGTVELHRSINNLPFVHVQTIDCVRPVQIEFASIQQSDDLLLLILSESYDQPFIVYQYKGVAGFEQIVAASSLPTALRMHHIQLRSTRQHLIALSNDNETMFLEIMLKRI